VDAIASFVVVEMGLAKRIGGGIAARASALSWGDAAGKLSFALSFDVRAYGLSRPGERSERGVVGVFGMFFFFERRVGGCCFLTGCKRERQQVSVVLFSCMISWKCGSDPAGEREIAAVWRLSSSPWKASPGQNRKTFSLLYRPVR
jgi:hypothetical protein